jgi:hypothetical protein
MNAANAGAFTRLAEPVFIVGILHHSTGVLSSMMTIAPDRPGSIPILIIFSFKGIARHELMWVQCVAQHLYSN